MQRLKRTKRVNLNKPKLHKIVIETKKRNSSWVLFNSKIYKTRKYKAWRTFVFKRDKYTCQLCGAKGAIQAHHIKKKSLFPELIFEKLNGITLCIKCHKRVTGLEAKYEKQFQEIIRRNTIKYLQRLIRKKKIKRL